MQQNIQMFPHAEQHESFTSKSQNSSSSNSRHQVVDPTSYTCNKSSANKGEIVATFLPQIESKFGKVSSRDKSIKKNEEQKKELPDIGRGKESERKKKNKKKNDCDDGEERDKFSGRITSISDDEFCTTNRTKTTISNATLFKPATKLLSSQQQQHPNQRDERTSISQFSALTLRRAFKFSRRTNGLNEKKHQQQQQQTMMTLMRSERKGSHGNLSSMVGLAASSVSCLPSNPGVEDHFSNERKTSLSLSLSLSSPSSSSPSTRRDSCKCCCCTNKCTTSKEQQTLSSTKELNSVGSNGNSNSNGHRTGIVRSFNEQASANQLTELSNVATTTTNITNTINTNRQRQEQLIGGTTTRRWQKKTTTPRKLIPVPPPIVPLHKQLACGLQMDFSANTNTAACDVYENSNDTKMISHQKKKKKDKTIVTFRLDNNNNDDDVDGDKCRFHLKCISNGSVHLIGGDLSKQDPQVNTSVGRMDAIVRNDASSKVPDIGRYVATYKKRKAETCTGGSSGDSDTKKTSSDYEVNWSELSHSNSNSNSNGNNEEKDKEKVDNEESTMNLHCGVGRPERVHCHECSRCYDVRERLARESHSMDSPGEESSTFTMVQTLSSNCTASFPTPPSPSPSPSHPNASSSADVERRHRRDCENPCATAQTYVQSRFASQILSPPSPFKSSAKDSNDNDICRRVSPSGCSPSSDVGINTNTSMEIAETVLCIQQQQQQHQQHERESSSQNHDQRDGDSNDRYAGDVVEGVSCKFLDISNSSRRQIIASDSGPQTVMDMRSNSEEDGSEGTPIVDVKSRIGATTCDDDHDISSELPQATKALSAFATATATAATITTMRIGAEKTAANGLDQNQKSNHHLEGSTSPPSSKISSSAIYDLPESSGAREFVRVELSDGRRKITTQRLPLRPARRPSMPPPPPPLVLQKQQQQKQAQQLKGPIVNASSATCTKHFSNKRDGTNSGCVVANSPSGRVPNSQLFNGSINSSSGSSSNVMSEVIAVDLEEVKTTTIGNYENDENQISNNHEIIDQGIALTKPTTNSSQSKRPATRLRYFLVPVREEKETEEHENIFNEQHNSNQEKDSIKANCNHKSTRSKVVRFTEHCETKTTTATTRTTDSSFTSDSSSSDVDKVKKKTVSLPHQTSDEPSQLQQLQSNNSIEQKHENSPSRCDKLNTNFYCTSNEQVNSSSNNKRNDHKIGISRRDTVLTNPGVIQTKVEGDRNEFTINMGSSHSSSTASVAATTAPEPSLTRPSKKQQQQQTSTRVILEQDENSETNEPQAATLTKASLHEEKSTSDGKKRGSYQTDSRANCHNGNKHSMNRTGSSNKTTFTTNNETAAPTIIKSLSSMTNKLVGEAKIMTGALKDATHYQNQQHVSAADGTGGSSSSAGGGGGKQHVPSALQMCIKGVVKTGHKSSHHQTSSADSKRPMHQQHGRLLERPYRGLEDSLERRRKSLQDGDVFIYPRVYKDLNECPKCLRDNRICNCIEIELSSDGSSSMGGNFDSTIDHSGATNVADPAHAANGTGPPTPDSSHSTIANNNTGAYPLVVRRSSHTTIEHDNSKKRQAVYDDNNAEGELSESPKYKISITTAQSIEQAPNLIMLTASSTSCINISDTNIPTSKDENNNNNIIIEAAIPKSKHISADQVSDQRSRSTHKSKFNSVNRSGSDIVCGSLIELDGISSPREPPGSQLVISEGDKLKDCLAPADQMSSLGPSDDSAVNIVSISASTANWTITKADRKLLSCSDSSLSPNLNSNQSEAEAAVADAAEAARQSLSSCDYVEVKRSPTSVSSVNQRSLQKSSSTKKVETKVTTISIGSLNHQRWQEKSIRTDASDSGKNSMISVKSHGSDTNNDNKHDKVADSEEQQPHKSIISIQTRRRNLATKLGVGRRAIYEDDDVDSQDTVGKYNEQQQSKKHLNRNYDANEPTDQEFSETNSKSRVPMTTNTHGIVVATSSASPLSERQLILTTTEPITIRDSLSPAGNDTSGLGGGVLDYSPILSSVRDYINNMNTELQVQTSTASPNRAATANLITSDIGCDDGGGSKLVESSLGAIRNTAELVVGSPSTISRSLASNKTLAALESPIQVLTSTATGIVQTTFTTLPATSIKAHVQTSSNPSDTADSSPKKSIFDGASKDEILEYLEDARERVPEILMAADDVMVISENELIVVNQLEPDSPATPISIVETNEIIGDGSDDGNEAINSSLMHLSSKSGQLHSSLTHPDQLRHHLEQMYQTSQLAAAAAAQPDTVIESTTGSIYDETRKIGSRGTVVAERLANDGCRSPDRSGTGHSNVGNRYISQSGANSPDFRLPAEDMRSEVNISSDRDKARDNKMQTQQKQLSPTNDRNESISTVMVTQSSPIEGLLDFAGPIYAGRRNSLSECAIQTTNNHREHAMQILALQKRYTNRNSLSSPSSSPPSSTSPSSSSSSNQTSGNCSVATSFYASSSLSCSSPLLNLNGNNSPAFNQSTPPLTLLAQPPPIRELGSLPKRTMNLGQKFNGYDLQLHHLNQDSIDTNNQSSDRSTPVDMADLTSGELLPVMSPDMVTRVDRDDSGIGSEPMRAETNRLKSMAMSSEQPPMRGSAAVERPTNGGNGRIDHLVSMSNSGNESSVNDGAVIPRAKLGRIDEFAYSSKQPTMGEPILSNPLTTTRTNNSNGNSISSNARFSTQSNKQNSIGIGSSRGIYGHYNTLNRLNNYFMNRHPFSSSSDSTVEFQCLDCDQFIDVDQATIMNKTNELRLLRATDSKGRLDYSQSGGEMTPEQLDRAYVAAMNGLPLCKTCEKKRIERKEIISEFVETELKYGRDLKIVHDEFYRPMQIAGLLSKDQINGVFLNLERLIMAHCKFADRLETAIREAHSIGDTDFNTVNIGSLFVESAEMLNTFESYCIRQGAAACLLARLAKERELLRIFLRVSQMENTLLRRMNLAAFLMVPVQRVTKYPLLLNRLYKVTAYHHKDREALRDAQLKVELHLEHINQQTKGIGASNKIWRRISSLSAPISNRRGLMNAEDIGYIKLRKTALDMLKWDRDETQFIHSGKIHFAFLTEYLTRQKMKPLRYMPAHALLIVLGRPNWKYRPDLVKANLDSRLMTPTAGGNGIKEAALLLFREKNGRFVPCREPLLLSNCVLSADCSQFNNECPQNQPNITRHTNNQPSTMNSTPQQQQHNSSTGSRKSCSSNGSDISNIQETGAHRSDSAGKHIELMTSGGGGGSLTGSIDSTTTNRSMSPKDHSTDSRTGSLGGDIVLISTLRGLIEDGGVQSTSGDGSPPNASAHSSRSYSLASALPRTSLATTSSAVNLSKPIISTASSNLTILNQLMSKVNNYHNRQSSSSAAAVTTTTAVAAVANGHGSGKQTTIASISAPIDQSARNRPVSPSVSADGSATYNTIITTTTTTAKAIVSSTIGNTPATDHLSSQQQQHQQQQRLKSDNCNGVRPIIGSSNNLSGSNGNSNSNGTSSGRAISAALDSGQPNYNNYHYLHHNHNQLYGDYEESFEIHERIGKESMLLRADTPLKTRYWLQMLRYHAKDLGQWRARRNGLPNIMMMRHE